MRDRYQSSASVVHQDIPFLPHILHVTYFPIRFHRKRQTCRGSIVISKKLTITDTYRIFISASKNHPKPASKVSRAQQWFITTIGTFSSTDIGNISM
jgi:hypothetical protein